MGFSIRHEIKAKIDDQYNYIVGLIKSYPKLSEDWRSEQFDKFQNIAKENSGGDTEIERDIYCQLVNGLEYSYLEESIFNNSMFLMVFSYFEGAINSIAVNENIVIIAKKGKPIKMPSADKILSQIEKTNGVSLSADNKRSLKCIRILRALRNYITHNNGALGSEKEKDAIRLIKRIKGVDIYKGTIVICDLSFVQTVLDKMYSILKELSIILNYVNKRI